MTKKKMFILILVLVSLIGVLATFLDKIQYFTDGVKLQEQQKHDKIV